MATAARPADAPGLVERLAAIVGPAHVLTEEVERRFYATDVLRAVEVPLAVVRPGSVDELAAVVRVAAEARAPVVVRGGGASYTDGYTHARPGGVTVDPSRLKAIMVDATNAVVTVEAESPGRNSGTRSFPTSCGRLSSAPSRAWRPRLRAR